MPVPTVDNNTVAEGAALLTSHYADPVATPVVTGVVNALMLALQESENATWSIINGVQLANLPMAGGPWNVEDQLGALVGAPGRNGMDDADYLAVIKIQIRVNISRGLAEDINAIAALVLPAGFKYVEWPGSIAAFELDASGVISTVSAIQALQRFLSEARSAGTGGAVRYATSATQLITWSSVHGGVTGYGFGSYYGGAANNALAALEGF